MRVIPRPSPAVSGEELYERGGGSLACAKEEKAVWELKGPSHLESSTQPLLLLWASCSGIIARKQACLPPRGSFRLEQPSLP